MTTYNIHDLVHARGVPEPLREAVRALLDRLEAAESDLRCCQSERGGAAALFLSVKTRLTNERDALRAEIEAMKRQEPVARTTELALTLGNSTLGFDACRGNLWGEKGVPLYALPGAHCAEARCSPTTITVQDGWREAAFEGWPVRLPIYRRHITNWNEKLCGTTYPPVMGPCAGCANRMQE